MKLYFDYDTNEMVLLENFEFKYNDIIFTIPKKFRSDGASSPRAFWRICPKFDNYIECYVKHDFNYTEQFISRKQADDLLLKDLREAGMSKIRSRMIWLSVRCFGWRHWKQHELSNWI